MPRIFVAAYTEYRSDGRVRREAKALVEHGYEVDLLALGSPGDPAEEEIDGVRVVKAFTRSHKPNSTIGYLADYGRFIASVTRRLALHPRRYDLVHTHNMPDALALGGLLHRLLGKPLIHDIHDLMPELYMEKFRAGDRHWFVRVLMLQEALAVRLANRVLLAESGLQDILERRGVPVEKMHTLLNLPDESVFPVLPLETKSGDAPFVLSYHGSLVRRLGLDIALDAVALCRKDIRNLEVRIIGDGEEREALVRQTAELGLEDVVQFSPGRVPIVDIPKWVTGTDVGIVPMRRHEATEMMLPVKLVEYAHMGIPCITPKTRTIARYFEDGMIRHFESGSAESLAEAIVDLHRHPERRAEMRQKLLEDFAPRYRWTVHRDEYLALVGELLGEKTREPAQ